MGVKNTIGQVQKTTDSTPHTLAGPQMVTLWAEQKCLGVEHEKRGDDPKKYFKRKD